MNITSGIKAEARPGGGQIAYFITKEFDKSLHRAIQTGGQGKNRAIKVKAILNSLGEPDPFRFIGISVTNHGESRIRNCVKYDLGDGWRLVTQQTDKTCGFLFVGDHADTDHWLDAHRGQQFAVKDGRTKLVPGSGLQIAHGSEFRADHHDKPLVERLDAEAMDHVLDGLPRSVARKLEALDARSTTAELESLVGEIPGAQKAELARAVFSLLLAGNYDGAQAHVDLSMGRIGLLDDVGESEMLEVADGEDIRRLRIGSPEYEAWLAAFDKRSNWYEWFLYLHPEQEKVVKADYVGVSQLSGVSGSGKTCVAVRRAMRLAESSNAKILLLTLNRSLAGLLGQLVDAACTDALVRGRIEVTSFFQLAQRLLHMFEPQNDRHFSDVTWKSGEHVDEVFREYYRQWTNNDDAKILMPLHRSMTARNVNGEAYLREEFDWIRSAVAPDGRATYLDLERKGRRFPILPERRQSLLEGLDGWERKMRDVGVIDYLGLTSALTKHRDKIGPLYTNILVDEAQDFGTTELRIIRHLVKTGPNDIFLCGDIAQTILPKHRSLTDAGLASITRERIRQNYRNSREILTAAYDVLRNNLYEEMFNSEDLEILDPKFANFSGDVPMALAADTLEEEIAYARTYAASRLEQGAKTVCVAFAGFSSRDVKGFAKSCGVTALDGAYDPSSDRLVFCDLEQTKGYEFDTLIILQCRDGILPPHDAPEEEAYRTSCKLYVAMTRAKRELILSFHGVASPWISEVTNTIGTAMWSEVEILNPTLVQGVPEILPEFEPDRHIGDFGKLTGLQFVYTGNALGISPEAQDKLIELVDGRGMRASGGGRRLRWQNMGALITDLNESRLHDLQFGANVAGELRRLSIG
ncbi:AAA family ATPase [Mesorhizobium sp. M1334]|uniref:3'-5' exonuclease n=1 Tax=Mesorhizobium sp. M1334 TaxID=2957084 RepID=UPI003339F4FF